MALWKDQKKKTTNWFNPKFYTCSRTLIIYSSCQGMWQTTQILFMVKWLESHSLVLCRRGLSSKLSETWGSGKWVIGGKDGKYHPSERYFKSSYKARGQCECYVYTGAWELLLICGSPHPHFMEGDSPRKRKSEWILVLAVLLSGTTAIVSYPVSTLLSLLAIIFLKCESDHVHASAYLLHLEWNSNSLLWPKGIADPNLCVSLPLHLVYFWLTVPQTH